MWRRVFVGFQVQAPFGPTPCKAVIWAVFGSQSPEGQVLLNVLFLQFAIWMKIGYDKFNEPTYWFGRPSNGPATWPKQRRVAQCEKRGVTALHGRNLFLRPEFQASMSHFAKFSQTECGALFVHSHLYGVPGYWFHGLAARSCRLGVPDFGSSSRLPNSNTNSMIRSVFCP